jgi:hypothetical protein
MVNSSDGVKIFGRGPTEQGPAKLRMGKRPLTEMQCLKNTSWWSVFKIMFFVIPLSFSGHCSDRSRLNNCYLTFIFLSFTSLSFSLRFPSHSVVVFHPILFCKTHYSLWPPATLHFLHTSYYFLGQNPLGDDDSHSGCNNVPCLQYRRKKLSKVISKKLTILKIFPSEAF